MYKAREISSNLNLYKYTSETR